MGKVIPMVPGLELRPLSTEERAEVREVRDLMPGIIPAGEIFTMDPENIPSECQGDHSWETLEDGTRVCFERSAVQL